MSERLTAKAERHEAPLALPTPEQAEPLRAGEADPAKALEEARSLVAETEAQHETAQADAREALQAAEKSPGPPVSRYIDHELRQITLSRELSQIRRSLPAIARPFSRLIHQPAVRAVSEAAGRTVSRPSGLLGGGLAAFVGSSAYLYLAKHIGFSYNYFVFLVLLGGGFVLGLVLELLVYVALRRRGGNYS